jgi:uncharacterized membrane protein YqjE
VHDVEFTMGVAEAILAVLIFLGLIGAVWAVQQKKAPEGDSNDLTNGETLL